MRLIDADRLTDLMQNYLKEFETMVSEHGKGLAHGTRLAIERIAEQPTIYLETLNPKWIPFTWRKTTKEDGWDILDNNLLQCSEDHIRAVFDMLKRQPHRPKFTGGLEAKILKPWHCELLREVKPERMYFAYDTPDDYEPLIDAGRMLMQAGITPRSHVMSCYNLIGYRGDTFDKAELRLRQTIAAGFMPYAMLYRDQDGHVDKEWEKFQREWLRPALVSHQFGQVWHNK